MNDNGRIINISTGTTRFCVFGYITYASMKGAIETFTRYVAKETGARGITCNTIAPGPVETDFNNAAIRNNPERKKLMSSLTALGRVGEASDIGGIVAFLCSDDAGWINGHVSRHQAVSTCDNNRVIAECVILVNSFKRLCI